MSKNRTNQNFQQKLKIFKEKWLKEEENRTPKRGMFHEDSFKDLTPSTANSCLESSMNKRSFRRNTISPAYVPGKSDATSSHSNRKPKMTPRMLFIAKLNANELDRISDTRNEPVHSRTDSKLVSKPKQKCRSARTERYEKLLKLRNGGNVFEISSESCKRKCRSARTERYEKSLKLRNGGNVFESSSESCISTQSSRSGLFSHKSMIPIVNDNPYVFPFPKKENISRKNVRRSSFHLRSPKLFPNGYEPNFSNQATDSSISNDYEMEIGEITSSEVSFPARQLELEYNSVVPEDFTQISSPSRNGINSQQKMQPYNILSWILPPNNLSLSDATSFSDDCMSSVGFSPVCDGTPLESVCSCASDVDMQIYNSTTPPTKFQNCIYGSNDTFHEQTDFLLDSFNKEENYSFSLKHENSLPFKKKQTQWCTFLDSLESALTTSMEKLNEIKNDF